MSKRFTDEERVAAVKKYESGYTAESVSTEYGISRSTLYTWRKSSNQMTADKFLENNT